MPYGHVYTIGEPTVARPFAGLSVGTPGMGGTPDICMTRQALAGAVCAIARERGTPWFKKLLIRHKAPNMSGLSDAVLVEVLRDERHCRGAARRRAVH